MVWLYFFRIVKERTACLALKNQNQANAPICLVLAFLDFSIGGGERDRTDDPLLAKQVLSQLSYTPNFLVGLVGVEPTTPALSRRCSNQLSYRPRFP
jgi:hypothetical protein